MDSSHKRPSAQINKSTYKHLIGVRPRIRMLQNKPFRSCPTYAKHAGPRLRAKMRTLFVEPHLSGPNIIVYGVSSFNAEASKEV
jgi:hypothetical protein